LQSQDSQGQSSPQGQGAAEVWLQPHPVGQPQAVLVWSVMVSLLLWRAVVARS